MAFAIKYGETIRLTAYASVAAVIVARARVRYVDGRVEDLYVNDVTHDATRGANGGNSEPANGFGEIVGAIIYVRSGIQTVNRGECYAFLATADATDESAPQVKLASGYVYDGHGLGLGQFEEAGQGRGNRRWLAAANDIAPVDVNQVLALSNMRRSVKGFIWYYNCAAVVATRTIQAFLGKRGPSRPTGFDDTLAANDSLVHWASSVVSLTTGEEGQIYAMNDEGRADGFTAMNDNGTLTLHSTATNPNPFPVLVDETDDAEILFDVGAADAGDRHSIWVLLEEWVVPDA